jgi:uncharacterized protein
VALFGGAAVLKARVRAAPAGGAANEALCKLIAKWLGVPPSSVAVASGATARVKRLRLVGEPDALAGRIAAALDRLGGA